MDLSSTTAIAANTLAHLPIDVVVLFALFLVMLVDGMRSGVARPATFSVSLPLTLFITTLLPQTAVVGPMLEKVSSPYIDAGIFLALFITLSFLIYRILCSAGVLVASTLTAIVASACVVIIFVAVWLHVPALQHVWHFSPLIETVFGSPYTAWWLILGFLGMGFVRS